MDICDKTFSLTANKLPTIKEIQKHIIFNRSQIEGTTVHTFEIRSRYTKCSFCLLSHEFLLSIVEMFKYFEVENVVELAAGCGWLSWWIKKYGFENVKTIDNMTWADEQNWNVLPIVNKEDAVQFVKNNKGIELYILSWPYTDELAKNIWDAMYPNQYLLYIGEEIGGCTANDKFFKKTNKYRVKYQKIEEHFKSFYGLHDHPILLKKRRYKIWGKHMKVMG